MLLDNIGKADTISFQYDFVVLIFIFMELQENVYVKMINILLTLRICKLKLSKHYNLRQYD